MGKNSKHHRGSLEYWPHRRAHKQMPRVRNWPSIAEAKFEGFVAVKAGMTHVAMIDDSESPAKGSEVSRAVTILEMPRVFIYGVRLYGNSAYKGSAAEVHDKALSQKVGIKNDKSAALNAVKQDLSKYVDASALAFCDESNLGFGNKRVLRFEIPVGGKSVEEKVTFLEQWLGKELKASNVFNTGEYIDVTTISKGKGWAGVIKRFGVSRQVRKATGKVRHLGVLGAWHPAKVLYSVPHAGHMGYNYRTELNKRVLKLGTQAEANAVNVKGGFLNYGVVKNDFVVLDGSIPGPARRLVRIRKAMRSTSAVKVPNVTYISLASKQG